MFVLIIYDVDTSNSSGAKRLRKVAKLCERYGMRVQNSVFEVLADATKMAVIKNEMSKIIDPKFDSVRFYRLGNNYSNKIDTMGRTPTLQTGEVMIL